jgi:hypothetical protein
MYLPDWVGTVLTIFVSMVVAGTGVAAIIIARGKAKSEKLVKDTTEQTTVKSAIDNLSGQIDRMDRSTSASFGKLEQQYCNIDKIQREHDSRLIRIEEHLRLSKNKEE